MTIGLIALMAAATLSLGYWVTLLHRRLAVAQAELDTARQGQIIWLRRSPVRVEAFGR